MKFIRWLFRDAFLAEYNAGYRAAVDRILLLPEKLRIGGTLTLDESDVSDCSFVGGAPAVLMRGDGHRVECCHMERCATGIHIEPAP